MSRVTVWAPGRRTVEVVVDGRRFPLLARDGGWWEGECTLLAPGVDHAFSVDGGDPVPDPRAAWLPYGVHGPARVVDHEAFAWSDEGWSAPPLESAVFYELHVGTFSPEGTFDGAIALLGHLKELGVTHVELMPVNAFPGRFGWGYDGVGLYAPHAPYGGPDGLKRLVDACHAAGLAAVLDVVYNHLGPDGNHLARFGPYFTDVYHTPWGEALNLDGPESDEVRRFLVESAVSWLRDYHFDGLRIDAVHAFYDRSAVHFLEQLAARTDLLEAELGRPLVLIAESDLNDPRLVRSSALGGFGLDAQWSDDFHHALHVVLTGESDGYYADFHGLADLAKALERVFVLDGRYSAHRMRSHGRPVEGLARTRFLGFLQNHDQVGNRALGERMVELAGPRLAAVGTALVLTAPFVPLLFQGEEWGASTRFPYFADHVDPDLARAVREGRRREFAAFAWSGELPDSTAEETFAAARLDWEEPRREPHASQLAWTRELIALRARTPALRDGEARTETDFDERARWLRVVRGPCTIAAAFGPEPCAVPLRAGPRYAVSLASGEGVDLAPDRVRLPAESVAILEERGA